jgi:hypothetical protein
MENPEINKNRIKKNFKLNSKNFDIDVVKNEEDTAVKVEVKSSLLKTLGTLVVKGIIKKFSK